MNVERVSNSTAEETASSKLSASNYESNEISSSGKLVKKLDLEVYISNFCGDQKY